MVALRTPLLVDPTSRFTGDRDRIGRLDIAPSMRLEAAQMVDPDALTQRGF